MRRKTHPTKPIWCHRGGHWFRHQGTITERIPPLDCPEHDG
ncbi:hypothetical protein RS85_02217 [Microbacterium sp. SA39]|nr:hypothetical protein RS85_02217 [Microbacterium sp. SA39]